MTTRLAEFATAVCLGCGRLGRPGCRIRFGIGRGPDETTAQSKQAGNKSKTAWNPREMVDNRAHTRPGRFGMPDRCSQPKKAQRQERGLRFGVTGCVGALV